MEYINVAFIGDDGVGKSTLIRSFMYGANNDSMDLTNFENYQELVKVGDKTYTLNIWDTKNIQHLINVDVFVLCYSIISINSYNNIKGIWLKEIRKINPNAKIVIVSTKCDLRTSNSMVNLVLRNTVYMLPTSNLINLSHILKTPYIQECSSFENLGIEEVFVNVIKAYNSKKKTNKWCCGLI